MKTFEFKKDVHGTTYLRFHLEVTAETEQEAIERVKPMVKGSPMDRNLPDGVRCVCDEFLLEDWHEDVFPPYKKDATVFLMNEDGDDVLSNQPLRRFYENERVFVCTYGENHGWGVVCEYSVVKNEDDMVFVILDDGTKVEVKGVSLYELSRERCPKCGRLLCFECEYASEYKYFCPDCDENFHEKDVM